MHLKFISEKSDAVENYSSVVNYVLERKKISKLPSYVYSLKSHLTTKGDYHMSHNVRVWVILELS